MRALIKGVHLSRPCFLCVTANPLRQSINVSERGKTGLFCPSKRARLHFLQMRLFSGHYVEVVGRGELTAYYKLPLWSGMLSVEKILQFL
jgi:hypothetical protein